MMASGFHDLFALVLGWKSTVAAVPATVLGMEFTAPDSRMHFTAPDSRMHFTAPDSRMHFEAREED